MRESPAPLPRRAAIGLALVLALGGCSTGVAGTAAPDPAALASPTSDAPQPDPSGDTFDDARGRFGIVPPPGWSVDGSGVRGTAVVFTEPEATALEAGPFRATINVFVTRAAGDLPATVAGAREELKALTGYRPTADEPVVLGDGTQAHLIGGTFAAPESGIPLRNLQLFTVHEDSTVFVTGTSLLERWDAYGPVFDTSLRTLTVAA